MLLLLSGKGAPRKGLAAALRFLVGHVEFLLLGHGEFQAVLLEAVAITGVFRHGSMQHVRHGRILIFADTSPSEPSVVSSVRMRNSN